MAMLEPSTVVSRIHVPRDEPSRTSGMPHIYSDTADPAARKAAKSAVDAVDAVTGARALT
ncbi:hypothetical protein GCM10009566_13480 [Streptomyces murinus]